MVRSIQNVLRLFGLARILARHDALCLFDQVAGFVPFAFVARMLSARRATGRPGERLARALQDAGPSFIKLGQALSTRSDLVGEEIAADLSHLQDQLPPFPGARAVATIEAELGRPLADLFRSFEERPAAAASIAQVHFAVDREGRDVAVKVLRPGIEESFRRDLDLFFLDRRAHRTEPPRLATPPSGRIAPVDR